jgi:nucleotide-binding universal stress UspA family protein
LQSALFKKLVVAYDGSDNAARAVRTACSLAKQGAALVLVHVYSAPVYLYAGPAAISPEQVRLLEDGAMAKAREILARGVELARREGANPKSELLESASTVQALVEFSANEKADLLVVGTRGMTGFKKLILGSVSGGVINHATCSVLVVR